MQIRQEVTLEAINIHVSESYCAIQLKIAFVQVTFDHPHTSETSHAPYTDKSANALNSLGEGVQRGE